MFEALHRWGVFSVVFVMFVWIGGETASGGENNPLSAQENQLGTGAEGRVAAGTPGTGKVPESGITEGGWTPIEKDSTPDAEQKAEADRHSEEDVSGTGKKPESGISEKGSTGVQARPEGGTKQREMIEPSRGGLAGTGKQPESGIRKDENTPPVEGDLRGYDRTLPEGSESPEPDSKTD